MIFWATPRKKEKYTNVIIIGHSQHWGASLILVYKSYKHIQSMGTAYTQNMHTHCMQCIQKSGSEANSNPYQNAIQNVYKSAPKTLFWLKVSNYGVWVWRVSVDVSRRQTYNSNQQKLLIQALSAIQLADSAKTASSIGHHSSQSDQSFISKCLIKLHYSDAIKLTSKREREYS